MAAKQVIEEGADFLPKFDSNGLINAIAQDAKTGQVLMAAFMNKQSLDLTIQTGFATYFSRSRQKLWKKGEESGHFQKVEQILVDCDQDCLILKVTVDAGQCHVGYQSCFYRALKKGSSNKPAFSPASPKRVEAGEVPRLEGREACGSPKGGLEFIAEKTYNPKETYLPRLTRPSASPRGERKAGKK